MQYRVSFCAITEEPLSADERERLRNVIENGSVISALRMKGPVTRLSNASIESEQAHTVVGYHVPSHQTGVYHTYGTSGRDAARNALMEKARDLDEMVPADAYDNIGYLMDYVDFEIVSVFPGHQQEVYGY